MTRSRFSGIGILTAQVHVPGTGNHTGNGDLHVLTVPVGVAYQRLLAATPNRTICTTGIWNRAKRRSPLVTEKKHKLFSKRLTKNPTLISSSFSSEALALPKRKHKHQAFPPHDSFDITRNLYASPIISRLQHHHDNNNNKTQKEPEQHYDGGSHLS
jgi:hypothetical protein